MADQARWWKLWGSALDDPDLDNLSHDLWACWAKFGLYTKIHGDRGTIHLTAPGRVLQSIFRVKSWEEVVAAILRFPNIFVATGPISWPHGRAKAPGLERGTWLRVAGVSTRVLQVSAEGGKGGPVTVGGLPEVWASWRNWAKYQEDSSAERTRKWRVSKGGEKRPVVTEQKRRDEKRTPKPPSASPSPPPNGAEQQAQFGRQPDGRYVLHDGMFNLDCPDPHWRSGLCVKSEYLSLDFVPNPRQCPAHEQREEPAW